MDGWAAASEFDHGDEVVDVAEAVGHADGGLDLVVERLEPGVGVAESDGFGDVVLASADLPAQFDDLGDAAVGGPEDCLCSMVLRPVERLVFSPKER